MSAERVLVVGPPRSERLREALSGLSCLPAGDRWGALGALRAEDVDVVVTSPEADLADLVGLVRENAPTARIVAVSGDDGWIERTGGLVCEVVRDEHVPTVLRHAVRRAVRMRNLATAVDLHERTAAFAGLVDAEALAVAIATVAREVSGADHALYVAPGPDGALAAHPATGGTGKPPTARLVRMTQRLEREPPDGPVSESQGDHVVVGVALRSDGRFHGVVWVVRARTRRRFAEREIRSVVAVATRASPAVEHVRLVRDLEHRLVSMEATRSRLEEDGRAATVGRLAVDALHALHAPLAYTRTNLRAVLASGELAAGSGALRHLEYALEGLGRADRAVEDLSRVSQGRDRVPVEVRQLIDAALALVRPLRIRETIEVSENAVILGNPGRLAQALAELLRNADQADGATRVDLTATRSKGAVAIEIADDGEGIAADLLPRVTEGFFSTRGRAGLGLTTAREVIERSGGTLELRSRRGVGTMVRVQLPGEKVDDEFEMAGEADADEPVGDLGDLFGE